MNIFKNFFSKFHKPTEFIDSNKYNLNRKHIKAQKRKNRILKCVKWLPIILFGTFTLKGILLSFLWFAFITIFFDHRDITDFSPTIRIWFGVPGSGKTSVGAWLTRNSLNQSRKVLANVHIDGAYILEENDLGRYDMSFDDDGCHVIYDEAVVNGLDNRAFKTFSKEKLTYFSLHRHMNNRVDVFSQDYDVDLKIKGRAGENGLFHLTKFLPGFVMYRRIKKIFFIKKDDKQFVDGFKYKGLPRICYTRSVWKSFNTLDKSNCPTMQKEWKRWDSN